jgi:hypothetical protein
MHKFQAMFSTYSYHYLCSTVRAPKLSVAFCSCFGAGNCVRRSYRDSQFSFGELTGEPQLRIIVVLYLVHDL